MHTVEEAGYRPTQKADVTDLSRWWVTVNGAVFTVSVRFRGTLLDAARRLIGEIYWRRGPFREGETGGTYVARYMR